MSTYKSDGKAGPWAKEKLKCLGDYLSAYTKVFRNQRHWCKGLIYIDAFAGAGNSELRQYDDPKQQSLLDEFAEKETYIKGSARVALEIDDKFNHYYFIEKNPERVRSLQLVTDELGMSSSVKILQGNSDEEIEKILSKYDWPKFRGVVFLDPFAMQVPWRVIEKIAAVKSLEIILNFPVSMAIQRTLPRKFELADQKLLSDYFGSDDWIDIVYDRQSDMLGETIIKRDDADRRLAIWYKDRLEKAFGFSSSPRVVKNTKKRPIYYLLWAGANETGKKIATWIFKQGEIVR